MAIFELRILIATLKMYSQTGWADRAEIFRIVKEVDCRTVYLQNIVPIWHLWTIW